MDRSDDIALDNTESEVLLLRDVNGRLHQLLLSSQ